MLSNSSVVSIWTRPAWAKIIYFAIDNNPTVLVTRMCLYLIASKLLLRSSCFTLCLLHSVFHGWFHPSTLTSPRLNGVAECQMQLICFGHFNYLWLNHIPTIIHHTGVVKSSSQFAIVYNVVVEVLTPIGSIMAFQAACSC